MRTELYELDMFSTEYDISFHMNRQLICSVGIFARALLVYPSIMCMFLKHMQRAQRIKNMHFLAMVLYNECIFVCPVWSIVPTYWQGIRLEVHDYMPHAAKTLTGATGYQSVSTFAALVGIQCVVHDVPRHFKNSSPEPTQMLPHNKADRIIATDPCLLRNGQKYGAHPRVYFVTINGAHEQNGEYVLKNYWSKRGRL